MKFEDLSLSKRLLDAVRTAGYETPTQIQAQVIPLALEGKDVLGCAQTGTGKTAAFALPIIERLSAVELPKLKAGERHHFRNIRCLVLAPTRELAQQISDSFQTYGRYTKVKRTVVYGGVNKRPQMRTLRQGVDVLVATPGRLLDHMSDGTVKLNNVEILVLDEADNMLDMGFLPDIKRIISKIPKKRQTLLLSATMPSSIRVLASEILDNPVSVEAARVSSPAENVEHWSYRVEKSEKPGLLCSVLNATPFTRALVFTKTKHGADKVARHLDKAGISADTIHGNKSQNARARALAGFRSGKTDVLVATDIAARGLDINNISHVINYDLTAEPETYVHRIGRTGRAGATGTALSFVSGEDRGKLRAIERLIRMQLQPAADIPGYVAPPPQAERPNGNGRGQSDRRRNASQRHSQGYRSGNNSRNGNSTRSGGSSQSANSPRSGGSPRAGNSSNRPKPRFANKNAGSRRRATTPKRETTTAAE